MSSGFDPRIVGPGELSFLQAAQRVAPYHLGGGAALAGVHLRHRLSADADLFVHAKDVHRDLVRALPDIGAMNGTPVSILRDGGSFVRARLHLPNGSIALDVVHDPVPDVEPAPAPVDGIVNKRGDSARAESLWNRALAIRQAALAADPKNTRAIEGVANIRGYLGELYRARKQVDDAISQHREYVRLMDELVAIRGMLPGLVQARAFAQSFLALALVDRAETQRAGDRAASANEARRWLSLAEPVARKLGAEPASELMTYLNEVTTRLRRLGS